jgi:Leucine-rich repeat (LRR) protein
VKELADLLYRIRLTDLDLSGNRLTELNAIEALPCLQNVNFDDNSLCHIDGSVIGTCLALQTLRMSNNALETFDVSFAPNLRTLYLDDNRLVRVDNLATLRSLDSLSVRRQQLSEDSEFTSLGDCSDARKLYLSANKIPCFTPNVAFLNLQFLELASAGLSSLPANLAEFIPNARSINLNFNGLKDLRALCGIPKLRKLSVVGNRLGRLRKTAMAIASCPSLVKVDMRNNPLTVGFYPPVKDATMILRQKAGAATIDPYELAPAEDDDDEEKADEEDRVYRSRLDEDTKLRRRVYELLLANGCQRLAWLDGRRFDGPSALRRDDAVWSKLVDMGVLLECQSDTANEDERFQPEVPVAATEVKA